MRTGGLRSSLARCSRIWGVCLLFLALPSLCFSSQLRLIRIVTFRSCSFMFTSSLKTKLLVFLACFSSPKTLLAMSADYLLKMVFNLYHSQVSWRNWKKKIVLAEVHFELLRRVCASVYTTWWFVLGLHSLKNRGVPNSTLAVGCRML